VADEAVIRMGALLEQLTARFELVVEAVSGFGGRLDNLREEIVGQFTEVGRQIRFLSEQIGENRQGIASVKDELGAEMVRLGEAVGATRVEFREHLAETKETLHKEIESQTGDLREWVGVALQQLNREAGRQPDRQARQRGRADVAKGGRLRAEMREELARTTAGLKAEIGSSAETIFKKVSAELKQTNKALDNLGRKFDRFDDRITVQTKDQEQRMRKLERRAGSSR
jgi:DNA repair exonuclease SbcCD ATPase subunit